MNPALSEGRRQGGRWKQVGPNSGLETSPSGTGRRSGRDWTQSGGLNAGR